MTHAIEMISRMKNNAALNKSRKERYQVIRKIYLDKVTHKIDNKEKKIRINKEEQEQIRREIIKEIKKERIIALTKTILLSIVISLIIFGTVCYLFII